MSGRRPRPSERLSEIKLSELISRRAVEILERNGGTYDREKLIREVMPIVPPGIALRANERDRKLNRDGRAARGEIVGEQRFTRPDKAAKADRIRYGQRSIVTRSLRSNRTDAKTLPWIQRVGDQGELFKLNRLPKIVVGDRSNGRILLPVLNALAATFKGNDEVWQELRHTAHDNGLHLASCPKDCKLIGGDGDE